MNIVACYQVRAMLTFSPGGERTEPPERLPFRRKAGLLITGINLPRPVNPRTPAALGLPFQTHRLRSRDGMALEAWFIPHPQPTGIVLMFHGYGAGKSCLLTEAQVFHQLGFSTFLSDFRGSGGSGGNQTSLGWHEADDVTAAVDAVRALSPARPIILYGQSMGAAAILRAISVNGLQPDGVILESVFDRMLNTVKNRFRSMGIPSFPSAQLIVLWGGVQTRSRGFANNPVEYAKAVRCPVLMLHGANDPRATPTQARTVFDNLGGRKHIEIFEGVGHQSCLPANPEKWKNAVSKFLALCHGPMRNASEGPK